MSPVSYGTHCTLLPGPHYVAQCVVISVQSEEGNFESCEASPVLLKGFDEGAEEADLEFDRELCFSYVYCLGYSRDCEKVR